MIQASDLSLKFCLHDANSLSDEEKSTSCDKTHTLKKLERSGVTLNDQKVACFSKRYR